MPAALSFSPNHAPRVAPQSSTELSGYDFDEAILEDACRATLAVFARDRDRASHGIDTGCDLRRPPIDRLGARGDRENNLIRIGAVSALRGATVQILAQRDITESTSQFLRAIANRARRLVDGRHWNRERIVRRSQCPPHTVDAESNRHRRRSVGRTSIDRRHSKPCAARNAYGFLGVRSSAAWARRSTSGERDTEERVDSSHDERSE
jgi:hypothetical protein